MVFWGTLYQPKDIKVWKYTLDIFSTSNKNKEGFGVTKTKDKVKQNNHHTL